jgi:integrase
VLLNERALHALAVMRPLTEAAGSCVFRSARYGADFETEKPFRYIFNKSRKKLGLRHRKAYNTRHAYATMLLMAGVNINWVASQLCNSPLMVATVYAKWINGEADITEMAKLNTRAVRDADRLTNDDGIDENTEKNALNCAGRNESINGDENEIGSKKFSFCANY